MSGAPPAPTDALLGSKQVGVPVHVLAQVKVLPVITLRDPGVVVPLAQALLGAGVRAMEITLREAGALDAIEAVSTLVPEMTVAVGTVRTPADIRQAADAGASFALSPASPLSLLLADHPIPLIPGVGTASEVMEAWSQGYRLQKLFPAAPLGGVEHLRLLHGPLTDVMFVPTGGIDSFSASGYLGLPNVLCVGGSFLIDSDFVDRGDWFGLERAVTETLAALQSVERNQ